MMNYMYGKEIAEAIKKEQERRRLPNHKYFTANYVGFSGRYPARTISDILK